MSCSDTEPSVVAYYYTHKIYLGTVVGLERTIFTVSEDVGVVELCARVFEPDIECPIEFPFNIILSSTDRTAGTYLSHINSY